MYCTMKWSEIRDLYLYHSDVLIVAAPGKDPVEHPVARLPHEHLVTHSAYEKLAPGSRCQGRNVPGYDEFVWLLLMAVYLTQESDRSFT